MKTTYLLLTIWAASLLISCKESPDPDVETLYINGQDREKERADATSKLYEHYMNGKRDRSAYEVVAKGNARFVINYVPGLALLTLSGDPGSGWSNQFKDVDEGTLQKLIHQKLTFNDIDDIGSAESKYDSVLTLNRPLYDVKTNSSAGR
ncbi:hypothetical protein MUK70_17200 [Dyadobacter chenwenxiniae]|uniref:Uncharacterized protein n=1 Tax=Dyadobacter chenwenxiniae TaxID=2906456 RepID=A0A9X1PHV7_9BACT|nr:hypothetical protein [Dyadobacter chenwenxiniae]MCF0060976.1 hypothetical protein [Dyadobacter chenwenxiniae]UON80804.1 hypothetical protein MUK70_17200 [Dyadobacter chenwenxiniae]